MIKDTMGKGKGKGMVTVGGTREGRGFSRSRVSESEGTSGRKKEIEEKKRHQSIKRRNAYICKGKCQMRYMYHLCRVDMTCQCHIMWVYMVYDENPKNPLC